MKSPHSHSSPLSSDLRVPYPESDPSVQHGASHLIAKKNKRSKVNDGLRNMIETYLLTHFKWFWDLVQSNSFLKQRINKFLINNAIYKVKSRPYPLSTMTPYTSWDSLTDRTYSGRHLPPVETNPNLPSEEEVSKLFLRTGETILSAKSTLLFSYLAQWFTDSFLRTDPNNPLKNTSNHEIDLCPLYGLNPHTTNILRAHKSGKLRSQMIRNMEGDEEEYPPYYFQEGQEGVVKDEFKDLFKDLDSRLYYPQDLDLDRKKRLFAVGKETGNVQIGYVMIGTLFLREHNRICDRLAETYKDWDDEQLFQTARNILIVLLLKVVIEEYINHITPYHFKFVFDPPSFNHEKWHRQNWMSVEFDLLYRWHGLVPNKVYLDGQEMSVRESLWNNKLVADKGLGRLFEDASSQPAGEIGFFNTPPFLVITKPKSPNCRKGLDQVSIELGREAKLASYNDYREMCKFPRVTDFDQITANEEVQKELKRLYGHVDNIEFYVGIFAEDVRENSIVGSLMGRLVGIDAFSQIFTNPLLNENIFNEKTFSQVGLEIIQTTRSLSDVLHRNIPRTDKPFKVTLTQG